MPDRQHRLLCTIPMSPPRKRGDPTGPAIADQSTRNHPLARARGSLESCVLGSGLPVPVNVHVVFGSFAEVLARVIIQTFVPGAVSSNSTHDGSIVPVHCKLPLMMVRSRTSNGGVWAIAGSETIIRTSRETMRCLCRCSSL